MAASVRATTIRDVARAAGVSVASASRALNNHHSAGAAMRDRVSEAATRLRYVPHLGARSLSTRRTDAIGVVLPDLFGEFFSEMIRGIDYAAHKRGLQLLLANMHGDARETEVALRAMRGRVDGLIVMSLDAGVHLPDELRTVVINGGSDRQSCFAIDNHAGAYAAVAHLAARGARRIAHITGPAGNADAQERLRGFRDAVAALLGDDDPLVIAGDFTDDSGRAGGEAIAARRGGIDGVFAANDMMAVGCLDAFEALGLAVPDAVRVVGFDDVPIARYARPALSTMRVAIADLGTRALERLVAAIEAPDAAAPAPERLLPELIERRSSAITDSNDHRQSREKGGTS